MIALQHTFDMAEQERIQSRGIPLTSEDDAIDFNSNSFEGKNKFIPSLGIVRIFGSRSFYHSEDEMGITIQDGKITFVKANELLRRGFYEIGVGLQGLAEPGVPLTCIVILPENSLELRSKFSFGEDEIVDKKDIINRYNALALDWQDKGHIEYPFFLPGNLEFLAQLRFEFTSDTK